jgi:glycosyltransferase involved in cell wall biosynthesis
MRQHDKVFIIFSPAFPADENDTIWLPSLQTFVRALNRNFPELKVIVFAFQYPHATKTYQWFNNTVVSYNGMHKTKVARLLMWMKIVLEVWKIKRQYHVVGIFSQWCTECTFIAKHIAKLFKLRQFCWILGQDARKSNTYVKRIRPKASSLITLSDFLVDEFEKNHGIRPQHVIPKGIDVSLFKAMPVAKDIDIIGAGSLSVLKQYDVFVQIISTLKKSKPDIKAMLCGGGEDHQHIKELVNKLSLNENLILAGIIQHAEVLQIMRRTKILLHPSSYEGFGTVCLEALYAGAHVVSFVQPMYCEIKNWHIVKTIEEMHDKALELLNDPAINYDERLLIYSIDDCAKAVMKLFRYDS